MKLNSQKIDTLDVNIFEANSETSPIGTSLLATELASLFVLKMVNSHANNSTTIGEA